MLHKESFDSLRYIFENEIEYSLKTGSSSNIEDKLKNVAASDSDKSASLEQTMRNYLFTLFNSNKNCIEYYKYLISLCIQLAQKGLISHVLPINLLSDTFDCLTLEMSEQLFKFVEENLDIFKSEPFFSACKNNVLRMCNDLLRKISRTQNPMFGGRILLFLAMFFPFSERSGLNIVSEFNVDNVTKYGLDPEKPMINEVMEEAAPEPLSKIDYNFYIKFWSLQDYFRNPSLCYNRYQWNMFVEYSKAVLLVFENYSIEFEVNHRNNKRRKVMDNIFPKFLTSQKLLVLQLGDIAFRRTIFIQFLVLFQYLTSYVKSRPESCELKPEQEEWILESKSKIYQLIKETAVDGESFLKVILKLLKREEHWNHWKNEGCPALEQLKSTEKISDKTSLKTNDKIFKGHQRKYLGDIVKDGIKAGKIVIPLHSGDKRIWPLKRDLMSICKENKKVPDLETYFEDAIQQSDPEAMIESHYKVVNQMRFAWPGLKLLTMKSSQFYAPQQMTIATSLSTSPQLGDYLDSICRKMARESAVKNFSFPGINSNSNDNLDVKDEDQIQEEDEVEDEIEEVDSEDCKQQNGEDVVDDVGEMDDTDICENNDLRSLSKEILENVSEKVGIEWKKLAEKLGYKPDEIEFFNQHCNNDTGRSCNMLEVWLSNEEDASVETLNECLVGLNLKDATKVLSLNSK